MAFSSLYFVIFVFICITGYFLIPKKAQWMWLLVFSCLYYLAAGSALILFLLFTAFSTYICARYAARGTKAAAVTALVLNFGMLGVLKYSGFLAANIGSLFGLSIKAYPLLLPLGISFYIFQATAYVLDVYWKKIEPQENFLKYLLFVSFFPQILQGPIGRYERLGTQLYEEHAFNFARLQRGLWRILWGFFKKMVIADNAAFYVTEIFDFYKGSYGLMGVLLYSAQLYADFSGGMDIVIGIAEILGITMDENFRQPFFSISLADFWRRWHITLGSWMKDYLFYPTVLTKRMTRFGKKAKKRFGKTIGRALPVAITTVLVFLVVGIWHGAAWHFIVYGLYNGLIMGAALLLTKPFRTWKKKLHISDDNRIYHAFAVLRTFVIVNISWFFDRSESVPQAFRMIRDLFVSQGFSVTFLDPANPAKCWFRIGSILIGVFVVLIISILREREIDVRGSIGRAPAVLRIVLFLLLAVSLGVIGNHNGAGGFIYANF